MKLITALFILLMSWTVWGITELRIDLPPKIQAGEIISVKAEIIKIDGTKGLASLNGATLEDVLYINKVGLIERSSSSPDGSVELSIIFLSPVKRIPLTSKDGEIKIYLTNTEVTPTEEAKDFILLDWKLPWKWPWWGYVILGSIAGIALTIANVYPRLKKKAELKKKRQQMWAKIFAATTINDIMDIWHERLNYFDHFPDLEKNFRGWEKSIYPYIFKQNITDDEKVKIQKSYQKFVSELPTRRDYGV